MGPTHPSRALVVPLCSVRFDGKASGVEKCIGLKIPDNMLLGTSRCSAVLGSEKGVRGT